MTSKAQELVEELSKFRPGDDGFRGAVMVTVLRATAQIRGEGVQIGYRKAVTDFEEIVAELQRTSGLDVVLPALVVLRMEELMKEYGWNDE